MDMCSSNGQEEECMLGKLEVKRPLGRPRRSVMYTGKMDLRERGGNGMDWIDLD
jgi:hypothetical protein